MMKVFNYFLLMALVLSTLSCDSNDSAHSVTFRVISRIPPEGVSIFISGNHRKLGDWQPDRARLFRRADHSWERSIEFDTGTHLEFKITRGSWRTEAIGGDGVELPNYSLVVEHDTTVTIEIMQWRDRYKGATVITQERMNNKAGQIELIENWRYHPGDDAAWSKPDFDDRDWETLENPWLASEGIPRSGWDSIGWFRLYVTVDSLMARRPLGFTMQQAGASEVYLNGKLLLTFGRVGLTVNAEFRYQDQNPKVLQFEDASQDQVIAVRYSNYATEEFHGLDANAGFLITIFDNINAAIAERARICRQVTIYQMLFTVVPLALAFLHFLLFVFYPRLKENLFYAICMLGWSSLSYLNLQLPFVTDVLREVWLNRLSIIPINIAILFGLLTSYANIFDKLPKRTLFYVICAVLLMLWGTIQSSVAAGIALYIFIAIVTIEIVRTFFIPGQKKESEGWIIGFGFVALALAVIYQILMQFRIVLPAGNFGLTYIYGVFILSLTVSIDLSRKYARTYKRLEQKLVQVKQLSAKTLEQERLAKDEEITRRLLEADNARKTRELEEARRLQLSMLPEKITSIEGLDICFYMQTATEVGGDYYDYHISEDGTVTIAIGDATGHGTKAGTMVTVIKSLFVTHSSAMDTLTFLKKCSRTIRRMRLGNLYMGMILAKLKNQELKIASAGMPPVYMYRKETRSVEEIIIKALPLGATPALSSIERTLSLAAGDTVLLLSDGYIELFNDKRETLDYARTKHYFQEVAEQAPETIVAHLIERGVQWRNGAAQNDDITFVVFKIKEPEIAS